MEDILPVTDSSATRWMRVEDHPIVEDLPQRVTVENIRAALAGIENTEVVSVDINRTGFYDSPQGRIDDLPDFIDVRLHMSDPGGHTAHVVVWAPARWNRRYLGTTGGGNRTFPQWKQGAYQKSPTKADAIRNGFLTAATDAANRDPRFFAWALDEQTGELDRDLMLNWSYRSTHEMTLAAKAVSTALYGSEPDYSYLVGSSGGGRQTLAIAQRHPDDYDGYWAADSAINWTKMHVAQLWPPLVMKELGNPLPPAKLAAFRAAAIAAFDAEDGVVDGIIDSTEFTRWDARNAIGTPTPAGPLTETDARVMQLIWDGPVDSRGERLWYGVPIAADSWGGHYTGIGLCCTTESSGELQPAPFLATLDWIGPYLHRDPDWDWRALRLEDLEDEFRRSVEEFAEFDGADPDLSELRAAGSRLLLSHGMADEGIPPEGTLDYYERIVQTTAGTDEFLRFFLCPGDAHASITGDGPGISMGAGISALMRWVEGGEAPESILCTRMDLDENVTMTRPVGRYPLVAEHLDDGPPATRASAPLSGVQ